MGKKSKVQRQSWSQTIIIGIYFSLFSGNRKNVFWEDIRAKRKNSHYNWINIAQPVLINLDFVKLRQSWKPKVYFSCYLHRNSEVEHQNYNFFSTFIFAFTRIKTIISEKYEKSIKVKYLWSKDPFTWRSFGSNVHKSFKWNFQYKTALEYKHGWVELNWWKFIWNSLWYRFFFQISEYNKKICQRTVYAF